MIELGMGKHMFVTVGTTQFNSLIHEITSSTALSTLNDLGFSHLTVQYGTGNFKPETFSSADVHNRIQVSSFSLKPSISADIACADLVVSHAGAGSVMDCLEARRPTLVVINDQLMDNHQTELAHKLAEEGYLHYCTVDTLLHNLKTMDWSGVRTYEPGDPSKLSKHLDSVFGF